MTVPILRFRCLLDSDRHESDIHDLFLGKLLNGYRFNESAI
jgi:hypothetical protein